MNKQDFTFEISLSVLNHLGRNLYRSFVTVLGEAISNAWDADAENVWIDIDRDNATLVVKDDGIGMTAEMFQKQFLRVGYSKRRNGNAFSPSGRPFIGRKGIGKLALLSSADKITVLTKTKDQSVYVGGVIDNQGLDEAITHDLEPDQYPLGSVDNIEALSGYTSDHDHGTIMYFENIKDGIRNTLEHLKKVIALYFRFSLIDDKFKIFVNDETIDDSCLSDLMEKTQFLWTINGVSDPYAGRLLENFSKENEHKNISVAVSVKGFIASTKHYRDRSIHGTGERVSVDLFVNGRLRERDILRHISFSRVVENYLYGQIHFDDLDDEKDRFTSSREAVVANDPKFAKILDVLRSEVLRSVINDWDSLRISHRDPGDPDNSNLSKEERNSTDLYNTITEGYSKDINKKSRKQGELVDKWSDELRGDAVFNFTSYGECFVAENLVRRYLAESNIPLTEKAKGEVAEMRQREEKSKKTANLNIDIRRIDDDLNYLDMATIAQIADRTQDTNNLMWDSKKCKPMRDAIMHTVRLSDVAQKTLTTVFENIKARVKRILSDKNPN